MSNPNPNAPLIQQLLDNGELLPSTVVLDGLVMNANLAPPVLTYDAHGWGFAVSDIGGRASRGVDALIASLSASGGLNATIAATIPAFHISRFYAPPVAYGFATRDNRYAKPASTAPLNDDQWQQALYNFIHCNNREWIEGFSGAPLEHLYRGQPGQVPFVPVNLSQYDTAAWRAAGITPFDVVKRDIIYSTPAARYSDYEKPIKDRPDHAVYDPFFDTRTDAYVTNYWKSYAIAVGATGVTL